MVSARVCAHGDDSQCGVSDQLHGRHGRLHADTAERTSETNRRRHSEHQNWQDISAERNCGGPPSYAREHCWRKDRCSDRIDRSRTPNPCFSTSASRLGSGDAAKAEVFDFEILVHTVFGAFAAEAGFLYPAEGGDFGGNEAGVDTDDAVFESFGDAPDA